MDSLEYVNCNLCGSDDSRVLYPSTMPVSHINHAESFRCTSSGYGIHPPIVKCQACGLVYTNPRWRESAILQNYQSTVDQTYEEEREGRVLTFKRNLRPLEELAPHRPDRRLLDVGCSIGIFLEIAQEKGWQAWGVEPSAWAAERAQKKGLRVVTGTLEEANFAAGFFDVVTMWDVVEHLTNPTRELREANRVLKPGGLICIHTINIESPFAKLMGHRWPWLMEMHLYYFSPQTLTRMLEKVGFKVIKIITQGRFLRLGYLISRLEPYSRTVSRGLSALARVLKLVGVPVPINLGDLFTAYAAKV